MLGEVRWGGHGMLRRGRVWFVQTRRSRLVTFRLGAVGCGEAVLSRLGPERRDGFRYGGQGWVRQGRSSYGGHGKAGSCKSWRGKAV
jgi:hypothetical protein